MLKSCSRSSSIISVNVSECGIGKSAEDNGNTSARLGKDLSRVM